MLRRSDFEGERLRVASVGADVLCISVGASPGASASLQELCAQLTPSERSVVELVLRGLSNHRIAELRQSSTKTIANQLSAAFSKLGVSGRRELHALFSAHAEPDGVR